MFHNHVKLKKRFKTVSERELRGAKCRCTSGVFINIDIVIDFFSFLLIMYIYWFKFRYLWYNKFYTYEIHISLQNYTRCDVINLRLSKVRIATSLVEIDDIDFLEFLKSFGWHYVISNVHGNEHWTKTPQMRDWTQWMHCRI